MTQILDRVGASLLGFTATVLLGVSVFVGTTLIWPPTTLRSLQIAVETPVTAAGPLPVRVSYCKLRDRVPAGGRWSLQNEVTVVLPTQIMALPVGCDQTRVVLVPLAPHVMPGRYRLQVEVEYHPWPWVTETVVRLSDPFEIRPAP